jgi:N-methylhydantoinase A/oxoprolinase/acetone carboxylase beta subunit
MGGTTSDVARLSGGRPLHNGRGAVVGGHRTTVRAPAIQTTGLGGDSRIQVNRKGEVTVGPRRVLPLCVLAESEPGVAELLDELHTTELAELSLLPPAELFSLQREPAATRQLSERERRIVEILRGGPASILGLSRGLDYPYLTCIDTSRLEETGVVIRSGFTPTDLLHVQGTLERWDARISRLALRHVAARAGVTDDEFVRLANDEIRRRLVRVIVSTGMGLDAPDALETDPLGARFFQSAASGTPDGIVRCGLALTVPVIGIGAPAHVFVPEAAATLGIEAVVPERSGVAGAVGAITGSVLESVSVLIRPAASGFTVHAPDRVASFTLLESARAHARERAVELARAKALRAGAERFFIRVHSEDRRATSADGGLVYIDTQVRAEAAGAPRVE